jgi:hypothetical protein
MRQSINIILALTISAATTHAAISLSIYEQGSDVVFSYSGSWDNWTTANTFTVFVPGGTGLFDSDEFNSTIGSYAVDDTTGGLFLSSGIWTNASFTQGDLHSGDSFGFTGTLGEIYAPVGYSAGDALSGSMVVESATLTGLGFTPGDSGAFSGGGNTVNFSVAPIPEPSFYALITGLLCLTGLAVRRKMTKV